MRRRGAPNIVHKHEPSERDTDREKSKISLTIIVRELLKNPARRPEIGLMLLSEADILGHHRLVTEMDTSKVWTSAKKVSGLLDITPHTLWHTIGSRAVSHGENLVMTGSLLGHANVGSTAIYAHVQLDPMRKAAERVSRRVAAAIGGGGRPVSSSALIASNDP